MRKARVGFFLFPLPLFIAASLPVICLGTQLKAITIAVLLPWAAVRHRRTNHPEHSDR